MVIRGNPSDVSGRPAVYRRGFLAVMVPTLPDQLRVDGVDIFQTTDHIDSMRVRVIQESCNPLLFRKKQLDVSVSDGVPKTICTIRFTVSDNLRDDLLELQAKSLGAIGMVAAMFDDRVAVKPLFEDYLIKFGHSWVIGDMHLRVRHFADQPIDEHDEQSLATISGTGSLDAAIAAAARWYLKAAELGPVADAIIFFWLAIESILKTQGHKVVRILNEALDDAGFDRRSLEISTRRLYGLRGDIVHQGVEAHDDLSKGFYDLEAIARHLLRFSADVTSTWPSRVVSNRLPVTSVGEPTEHRVIP